MKALLVYPVHANCDEAVATYQHAGINAACFPGRRTVAEGLHTANCWNPVADEVEAMGLSVVKAACPGCQQRTQCQQLGYLGQLMAMKGVTVGVCTHKRAERSGFREIAGTCEYVSIHENPIGLLRPRVEASDADLWQLQCILNRLLNDPHYLDWFGEAVAFDEDGQRYHSDEEEIRRQRLYEFALFLSGVVDQLLQAIGTAMQTGAWSPATTHGTPDGLERLLFKVTKASSATFSGQPWRLLLSIATGQTPDIAILVQEHFIRGGETSVSKSVVAFRENPLPSTATVWLNDATLTTPRVTRMLQEPVTDATPQGHLTRQRKAVQIPRDITRRTSTAMILSILRGVLVDRPQFTRIGMIGHSNHMPVIENLEPEFKHRIVKTSYFGSGEERSSNEWHKECDLILVLGTPRLPTVTIAAYLIQVGEHDAASRKPVWGEIRWDGFTESQEPVTIDGRGYYDETWRDAHRDLVRASIIQAVGRGRGILETGCEVLVLSTEECGLPLSDATLGRLGASSVEVLSHVRRLSPENPNRYLLGKTGVSTGEIARACNLGLSRARELLAALEARGLVMKVGQRGGWLPVQSAPGPDTSQATAASPVSLQGESDAV